MFTFAAPPAPAIEALPRPLPAISRALIVSIDGLRPDLLLRADAPVLDGLMARGSYTMWANTTPVAVTLPSHASMLTGVSPTKHNVTWNGDHPAAGRTYSERPTIFDLAHQAGLTTAMIAGKSKFSALAKPGTLDFVYVPTPSLSLAPDQAVADSAVAAITRMAPQVLFVHLPLVDSAGHEHGWGSAQQMAAITEADRCLGLVLAALERRGVLDSTLVIVSTDHGGAGKSHGPDDPRSSHIPWIVAGPGVRANLDLTIDDDLTIRTEDTFATVAFFLGIEADKDIEGRPVVQILQDPHVKAHGSASR